LFDKYGIRTITGQKPPLQSSRKGQQSGVAGGPRNRHGAFRPAIVPQQYF
jgi:hypothetical protein